MADPDRRALLKTVALLGATPLLFSRHAQASENAAQESGASSLDLPVITDRRVLGSGKYAMECVKP